MAGKGNPKTGGRQKGTPNKTTRRLRQLVNGFVYRSLPRAEAALDGLWGTEPLEALTLYTKLIEYVSPKMGRIDPLAEQMAAQAAEQQSAAPPPVSIETVLAAFHAMPRAQKPPEPALPASANGSREPFQITDATGENLAPARIEPPAGVPIGTAANVTAMPVRESEILRHQGLPLPDGNRLIPAAPAPAPAVERNPEPKTPRVIEHEPADPYANSRQPSGCRPLIDPDQEGNVIVAGWR